MIQLSLFEQDFTKISDYLKKANDLLDLVNEGVSKKENFWAEGYFEYKEYYVLVAVNVYRRIYNIIDKNGDIPNEFEVNWRSGNHIIENLKLWQ